MNSPFMRYQDWRRIHRSKAWDQGKSLVDAGPIRSLVRQIMSDTNLPWRAISICAKIDPTITKALLFGCNSRPIDLISEREAAKYFDLDVRLIRKLNTVKGDPINFAKHINYLMQNGYKAEQISKITNVPTANIVTSQNKKLATVTKLEELKICAACYALLERITEEG